MLVMEELEKQSCWIWLNLKINFLECLTGKRKGKKCSFSFSFRFSSRRVPLGSNRKMDTHILFSQGKVRHNAIDRETSHNWVYGRPSVHKTHKPEQAKMSHFMRSYPSIT